MKVSVIVPVYNVNEWLDECIRSLVEQTFSDFEIILIDDGSTDGSETKCRDWARKDGRIRVINQSNSGPSIARNNGIKESKGEYVAFVDADDWVHCDFIKKLYQAAMKNDADIAECDVWRVDNRTNTMTYRSCSGVMGKDYSLEDHMKYGYTAVWKCIFRKSLFVDNNIEFPNCHSESKAVYPLLLALSNKIVNVKEGLYYYRRFRKNSLTETPRKNDGDENSIGINAFNALLEGFVKHGIYLHYENLLEEIVKYKLSDMLAVSFYRKSEDDYKSLRQKYKEYLMNKFPKNIDSKYVTWGGYNLNRILWNMNYLHDPYTRFNFSSIVSIMHPLENGVTFTHKNKYREIMVQRELDSLLWNVISEEKPEFIVMDFLEERFDLCKVENAYITNSDAFVGGDIEIEAKNIVCRKSEKCLHLWKESWNDFVRIIKKNYPWLKIILVKNYLSEYYGNINEKWVHSDVNEIREINDMLSTYYQFAETYDDDIFIVTPFLNNYYFTDMNYEYGNIPSHLNELVNLEIAMQIEKTMKSNGV